MSSGAVDDGYGDPPADLEPPPMQQSLILDDGYSEMNHGLPSSHVVEENFSNQAEPQIQHHQTESFEQEQTYGQYQQIDQQQYQMAPPPHDQQQYQTSPSSFDQQHMGPSIDQQQMLAPPPLDPQQHQMAPQDQHQMQQFYQMMQMGPPQDQQQHLMLPPQDQQQQQPQTMTLPPDQYQMAPPPLSTIPPQMNPPYQMAPAPLDQQPYQMAPAPLDQQPYQMAPAPLEQQPYQMAPPQDPYQQQQQQQQLMGPPPPQQQYGPGPGPLFHPQQPQMYLPPGQQYIPPQQGGWQAPMQGPMQPSYPPGPGPYPQYPPGPQGPGYIPQGPQPGGYAPQGPPGMSHAPYGPPLTHIQGGVMKPEGPAWNSKRPLGDNLEDNRQVKRRPNERPLPAAVSGLMKAATVALKRRVLAARFSLNQEAYRSRLHANNANQLTPGRIEAPGNDEVDTADALSVLAFSPFLSSMQVIFAATYAAAAAGKTLGKEAGNKNLILEVNQSAEVIANTQGFPLREIIHDILQLPACAVEELLSLDFHALVHSASLDTNNPFKLIRDGRSLMKTEPSPLPPGVEEVLKFPSDLELAVIIPALGPHRDLQVILEIWLVLHAILPEYHPRRQHVLASRSALPEFSVMERYPISELSEDYPKMWNRPISLPSYFTNLHELLSWGPFAEFLTIEDGGFLVPKFDVVADVRSHIEDCMAEGTIHHLKSHHGPSLDPTAAAARATSGSSSVPLPPSLNNMRNSFKIRFLYDPQPTYLGFASFKTLVESNIDLCLVDAVGSSGVRSGSGIDIRVIPGPIGKLKPLVRALLQVQHDHKQYMSDPDLPSSPIYPPFVSPYHKILDRYLRDTIELVRRPYGGVAASPPVPTLEYVLWVYETVYLEAFPDYETNPMFGPASLGLGLAPVLPLGLPGDSSATIKGLAMCLNWLTDVCRLSGDSVLPPIDPPENPNPLVPQPPPQPIDNVVEERIRIKSSLGGGASAPSTQGRNQGSMQYAEAKVSDPYSQGYGQAYYQPAPPARAAPVPVPVKAPGGPAADVGSSAVSQVIKAALALGMKLPETGATPSAWDPGSMSSGATPSAWGPVSSGATPSAWGPVSSGATPSAWDPGSMSSAQVALLAGSKKSGPSPAGPAPFMGPGGFRPVPMIPGLGARPPGPNPMMMPGGPRPFFPPGQGPMGARPPGGDAQYSAMLHQWYAKMASGKAPGAAPGAGPSPSPAGSSVSQEEYYQQWQHYYQALAAYNQATKGGGEKQ